MYRAITFIELLTTLVVMVIAFYFLSPVLFKLQDPVRLNNEIDQIKSFIYHVQRKSLYQQQDYQVLISQNIAEKRWCILAIAESSQNISPCDCLNIRQCNIGVDYLLYQPNIPKITLYSKSLYPNIFLRLNSISATVDAQCLKLSIHNVTKILQINSQGMIYEISDDKRSKCREITFRNHIN